MQPAAILSILVRAQGVSAATGELTALEGSAKKAGDATGQGVTAFGAPWYVVSPSGAMIG